MSAATTIGTNISTGGTLTVTGLATFGNASTTQISASSNIYTALTANSIPYIGTSGLLTQDTSNFVWDSTNNRLGIGTSSPMANITVSRSSANTTAGNEYASYIDFSDTGAVTTGTDNTYGQYVNVSRTGQSGGNIYSYGIYAASSATWEGTSRNYGVYGKVSGGDYGYGVVGHNNGSHSSEGAGVYGYDATGSGYGVKGYSSNIALYGDMGGTTSGNALKLFSDNITSANLAYFTQDTSVFTGTGLVMSFANGSGSFTGDFLDLRNSGASKMRILSTGAMTVATTTQFANTVLSVEATSTNAVPLTLRGISGQTGNLFQVQDSNATGLLVVDSAGNVGIATTSPYAKLSVTGFINTDQYSGYKQAGNTILYASSTNSSLVAGIGAGSSLLSTGLYNVFLGGYAGRLETSSDSNTYVGYRSGAVASGGYNTYVGDSTGRYGGGGNRNSLFGWQSGYKTEGSRNAFFGTASGYGNTTGSYNTYIGALSARSNSTGNYNTVLGYYGMYYNDSGSNNTIVGTEAGYGVSGNSNSNNSLLGYRSGYTLTTGSNNILLGYQAGDNLSSGSNNIIIGYDIDAVASSSANTLNIGNIIFGTGIDGAGVTASSGKIGIGTTSPLVLFTVGSTTPTHVSGYRDTFLSGALEVDGTAYLDGAATVTGLATFGNASTTQISASSNIYTALTANSIPYIGTSGLLTQDTSNFVWDSTNNRLGIGTSSPYASLSVAGQAVITATTTIGVSSTAQQAGIQIGFGGLCVDNDGSCNASTTGRVSAVDYTTGNTDLAEIYYSDTPLEEGEIISAIGGGSITLASQSNKNSIIGIISTKPGIILGAENGYLRSNQYPVALSGRVPVKVNDEGGEIAVGDDISLSSVSGVGKKAEAGEPTVGKALEPFSGPGQGEILVFVNIGSGEPESASAVANAGDWILEQFKSFGIAVLDGFMRLKELVADKITAKEKLCVGETCVNETQLKALLKNADIQPSAAPSGSDSQTATSTLSDTEPPVIELIGNNPARVKVGSSYSDNGAVVTDNVDENLGYKVSLDGGPEIYPNELSIDTSTATVYTITFTATDRAGNTGTAERKVIVGAVATSTLSTQGTSIAKDIAESAATTTATTTSP